MTTETIDRTALNQLIESIGGDKAFLSELIYSFSVDTPRLIESMRKARATNDAETFRRAAHSLKSNSANFGALNLAHLCKTLEEAGKRGELEGVERNIAQIENEFEQVKRALAKVREG